MEPLFRLMTSTSSEKLTGFFPPSKTVARNTKLTNPVVLVKVSDGYSADDNQEPAADVSETATIKYTTEENHDHLKVATPNAKTLLATAPDRTTCKKARKPRATKKQPPGAIEAGIEGSAPNVLESNGPPRKKARKSRASKEKPSLDAPEMKSNEKTKKPRAGKKRFGESPWPELKNPTPEECAEVNRRLTATHGPSTRPKKLVVNNSGGFWERVRMIGRARVLTGDVQLLGVVRFHASWMRF